MAQTLFLPPSVLAGPIPSSPDPTPLRLLAFSVAEAALQSDPNSPSLALQNRSAVEGDWTGPWTQWTRTTSEKIPSAKNQGSRLWNVVERAKERRVRTQSFTGGMKNEILPPSPPVSPASYNFVLPPHLPLAASIAASPEKKQSLSPDNRSTSRARLEARLNLASLGRSRPFPLYTRSAEPSPTKSTFSGLDQTRPPPEFVPRIPELAKEEMLSDGRKSPSATLRSQATVPAVPARTRHTARLPSLAQIQAKMAKAGHRRGGSVGSIPAIPTIPALPRLKTIQRTTSEDSVELLQTPTDELPPSRPRIILAGSPERRPATPPSPVGSVKEARLAPFLRERTSDRLAGVKTRPMSMPPLSGFDLNVFTGKAPTVTVKPPRSDAKRVTATVPPPSPSRSIILNTPPQRPFDRLVYSYPSSPTESIRSNTSTASPTLSVPMITCTPAPARFVRDGIEHDSDEEEGDVVLFEGENDSLDGGASEREERERRGKEMLERLTLRRRSG